MTFEYIFEYFFVPYCFLFQKYQISVNLISFVFYSFYLLPSLFKLFLFGSVFSGLPFMTLILFYLFSFLLLLKCDFIFMMLLFTPPPQVLPAFIDVTVSLSSLISRRTVQSLHQLHGNIFEMCVVGLCLFFLLYAFAVLKCFCFNPMFVPF